MAMASRVTDRHDDVVIVDPLVTPIAESIDASNVTDAADWLRCARAGNFDGAWTASDRIRARGDAEWDASRTIPFDLLRPLLELPRVSWYRLQRVAPQRECDPQLRRVDTTTVVGTAAAIRDLDLVLSIDSMPAHLAGALGAPVWTLL